MQKLRTSSAIDGAPRLHKRSTPRRESHGHTIDRAISYTELPPPAPEPVAGRIPSLIFHTLELFPMNLQLAPRNISSAAFFTIIFLHR